MANRTFNPRRALEKELVDICGHVSIASDASVTAGTLTGRGITSVVKSGTGEYTVTLQDKYSALLGYSLEVRGSGTIVTTPELKSEAVLSAGTFIIKTVTRSTGATADTAVAFELYFDLRLRNSSVA